MRYTFVSGYDKTIDATRQGTHNNTRIPHAYLIFIPYYSENRILRHFFNLTFPFLISGIEVRHCLAGPESVRLKDRMSKVIHRVQQLRVLFVTDIVRIGCLRGISGRVVDHRTLAPSFNTWPDHA